MKKFSVFFLATLFAMIFISDVSAQSKDEIKKAVLNMDFDDILEVSKRIEALKNESARQTGFEKGSQVGGAGGFYYFMPSAAINDNKPAGLDNIGSLLGGAGGFLINVRPNLAIGGLFGGFGGSTGKKIANDYWNYNVYGAFQMIQAQFKPIINDNFILGIDIGTGIQEAGYSIEKTDETMTGQDIVRSGTGLAYLAGIDVRKRLTYTWFLGVKLGYYGGTIDNLQRDAVIDQGKKLNLGSVYAAVSMGGNF